MCGIAGWIDFNNNIAEQRAVLQTMVNSLIPRGPDAEGIWSSPHALLGHRRLGSGGSRGVGRSL